MKRGRFYRLLVATVIAVVFIATRSALSENAEISTRRAAERTSFSNDEILSGFFKIAFKAELQFDQQAERIRKFNEPVRVFVINRGEPSRSAAIAAIVADIRAHVAHLNIAMTDDRRSANLIVSLVPHRDLKKTIRARYGNERAKRIAQSLNPQCLSGIDKDAHYRIRRAEVLLPVDAEEFGFYDCAYEELLQALGPINDDASVPWTMFNDDVQMGFFDIYDQYLLNILYDPRVRPGMTKEEFTRVASEVLTTVREGMGNANSPQPTPARSSVPQINGKQ
jgi:hypothetical protein